MRLFVFYFWDFNLITSFLPSPFSSKPSYMPTLALFWIQSLSSLIVIASIYIRSPKYNMLSLNNIACVCVFGTDIWCWIITCCALLHVSYSQHSLVAVVLCMSVRHYGFFPIHFHKSIVVLVLFMFRQSCWWDFMDVVSVWHSLTANSDPLALTICLRSLLQCLKSFLVEGSGLHLLVSIKDRS